MAANIFLVDTRVYVAGVLMPTISVHITSSFNQPPVAEITLPANPKLFDVGRYDRVPVHIFVRETVVECPDFILLFEGFITGRSYINVVSQREINIRAISFLDFLNDVQFRFMSQLNDHFQAMMAGNSDMTIPVMQDALLFPACLFMTGLGVGEEKKPIAYPTQYLENVFRFVQESGEAQEEGKGQQPVLGPYNGSVLANYVRTLAGYLRLLDRYPTLPHLDVIPENPTGEATMFPLVKGMQANEVMRRLVQGVSESPGFYSAMGLLDFLVQEVEYEFMFISNPAYHADPEQSVAKATPQPDSADLDVDPQPPSGFAPPSAGDGEEMGTTKTSEEKKKKDKLIACALKPMLTEAIPPGCNVVYRSQIVQLSAQEQYKGVPTRIQSIDNHGALALLTQEQANDPLVLYSRIDYFPSAKYKNMLPGEGESRYVNLMSNELLETEQFTGPWIKNIEVPRWFNFLGSRSAGETPEQRQIFKKKYLQRQLLNAVYFPKTLNVSCMFNPYITPGFPGVVFDSLDSGFSFAGHVHTVNHTLNISGVNTEIVLNFVRTLEEAAAVAIPHPLEELAELVQNKEKMTEIYRELLGTPKVTSLPGAEAVTFTDICLENTQSARRVNSPQISPLEAYHRQRRNICSFENYLSFIGLTVEKTGYGPQGPQTPLVLGGDFVSKRADIYAYKLAPKHFEQKPVEPQSIVEKKPNQTTTQKPELEGTKTGVRELLMAVAEEEFSRYVYV